jgi:hypothetical protein
VRYLEVDPYIPLPLWVALAIAAVAVIAAYAWTSRRRLTPWRWRGVVLLMVLAVVPPLVILLNPTWLEQIPPPEGKPLLTVLVDASASMATPDGNATDAAAASRYDTARLAASRVEASLREKFDVELRTYATRCQPGSVEELASRKPDGALTDLATALDEGLADDRPQGQAVLLLSDGVHNAGASSQLRDSVAQVKAAGVPVYTQTFGGAAGVNDIEVTLPSPQELAFLGQKITLRATVRQRGRFAAKSKIALRLDDMPVEEREVDLVRDGVTDVQFTIALPATGLFRYQVAATGDPKEVTDVNNSASLLVRVVDEPVKVLLLEGKPYWDTKFLTRTLAADPSISLTTIVRMAPGRLLERSIVPAETAKRETNSAEESTPGENAAENTDAGTAEKTPPVVARTQSWSIRTDAAALLADPTKLAKQQIIILGRDAEVFLSDEALSQLRKWLNAGDGSLVCFRGAPSAQVNERLAGLLPVRWTPTRESRFRVRFTPSGRDLHWLPLTLRDESDPLSRMPSLATVGRSETRPTLTTVLATTAEAKAPQEAPVVAYQPVGLGRVVVIEGAGMWRWAFLPDAYQQLDDVYGTLWRSLTRWLVASASLLPSQKLALRTDQVTYSADDVIAATLLVRESEWQGDLPKIELTRDGTAAKDGSTEVAENDSGTFPRTIAPIASGEAPGQYHVPLGKLAEGRYQIRAVGFDDPAARTAFDVRGNLRERLNVAADPDTMRFIAEETGGAVIDDSADDAAAKELGEKVAAHLARSRPERTLRWPAWDRWWVLASVIGLWVATWSLRRWSGLV